MTIDFDELEKKIGSLSALLFTMPESKSDSATEIWIKFRDEGHYILISFSRPLPSRFELLKLVGSGNALDVSDDRKRNLIEYNNTLDVKQVLKNSKNYNRNIEETVDTIISLFELITENFLHD